jgi:hypothetical protein
VKPGSGVHPGLTSPTDLRCPLPRRRNRPGTAAHKASLFVVHRKAGLQPRRPHLYKKRKGGPATEEGVFCNRDEADRLIIELTRRGAVSPGSVDHWQRVVDGVYLERGQSNECCAYAVSSHTKSLVLAVHADVGFNKH